MSEATLRFTGERVVGCAMRIRTLPGQESWGQFSTLSVIEFTGNEGGLAQADIQLLEECEYDYLLSDCGSKVLLEPEELFNPSDETGLIGRLRPRRSTGTVTVVVRSASGELLAHGDLEVRSRKLHYLSEYRWMLQRIADEASEAVQSYFAPSHLEAFRPHVVGNAETLYQRFAFIQSLLASAEFRTALSVIVNRPHHAYRTIMVKDDPSKGVKGDPFLIRALTRPGPRQRFAVGNSLPSLPFKVEKAHHSETLDTVPNQFVKHALTQWRYLAREVAMTAIRRGGPSGRRGQSEAQGLVSQLEEFLRVPMFKDVGPLPSFPTQNTVLQRRPGYRDVFRAYLQVEAASLVDWSGGQDAFGAGQRDVATLYEYWVFLELARIVDSIPGFAIDRRPLFTLAGDKLSLDLKRGTPSRLEGRGNRRGRPVQIELWFNRRFRRGSDSWSEPMQPDCSLRISTQSAKDVKRWKWLHFDAKYRVHSYREIFHGDSAANEEGDDYVAGPVVSDLLKMHAYRDAVMRTSGAYVLYPGFDKAPVRYAPYHEILPGLGAFVLRPIENGQAEPSSAQELRRFIEDAIDHASAIGTDEDRSGYWRDLTYLEARGERRSFEKWIDRPPADAKVLLGFIRGPDHIAWVETSGLYNLRADSRLGSVGVDSPELASEFVCLYDSSSERLWFFKATGKFVIKTGLDLTSEGYPDAEGAELYCCLVLGSRLDPPSNLNGEKVRGAARSGRPQALWAAPRCYDLDSLLNL